MNNYNRYYDRQNSQNENNSWSCNFQQQYDFYHKNDTNYGIWGQEKEVEFVDKKNRRIITRESLFEDPELFYSKENYSKPGASNSSGYSWTQHSWLKAGECEEEPEQSTSTQAKSHLHTTLMKTIAQPVQMTKAESMMQKMGWQGGALGKSGGGIVEPITPNAAYATHSRGFGLSTIKQQPQKVYFENREYFKTNVLLQILKFVKDNTEIEVLFEPGLFKSERKSVHKIVNYVINQEGEIMDLDNISQMDIVQEIHTHNNYILCTESEGEQLKRCLCLYKEAPDHVYLVTPNDLRDEVPDDEPTEEVKEDDELKNDKKCRKRKCKNKAILEPDKDISKKEDEDTIEEIMDVEEEEANPFLRSITRNLINKKKCQNDTTTDKKECVVDNIEETDLDATGKLVNYFKEFVKEDDYTEFRFLGNFSSDEVDRINEFNINLHSCVNSKKFCDVRYEDVLKCVETINYGVTIKEDCNGSIVIYKANEDKL